MQTLPGPMLPEEETLESTSTNQSQAQRGLTAFRTVRERCSDCKCIIIFERIGRGGSAWNEAASSRELNHSFSSSWFFKVRVY